MEKKVHFMAEYATKNTDYIKNASDKSYSELNFL